MSVETTPLGRAILGLLLPSPLCGYDIRRLFTQTPIAVFSDSPGAIYPALKRLEADGLVRSRDERSSGLRRRRVFRLTPAGTATFKRWLSTPVTHDDLVHRTDELMLRFSFMDVGIGEAASVAFLRSLQGELKTYVPELKLYLESHSHEMPLSGRLALDSGIRSYETMLQWTAHALNTYGQSEIANRKSEIGNRKSEIGKRKRS
jgi:DNA-binding PadR family transcriptional regulator